ncbi:conjugal transfer protein [Listeria seeligeri]|uniref:conjugal transfer protein n=1 Tax=Listeria seeligeri TaxID=1640 RepID=UPI001886F73F|nr:conjugal transfer protein [Listeria seeligeri]MBF2543366.1 conjugal transfer protein [Listeria seeligeri]MBF2563675.1 conjugal transfer protein [Listeria seeligeri]MBF2640372.1 conjugal transfer protein [Listeria seeligeri]
MIQRFKDFFQFMMKDYKNVHFRKKEKRTIKKEQNSVWIKRVIWLVIFFVSISGVLGYLKAVKAEQNTEKFAQQVAKENNNNTVSNESSEPMYLFAKDFISNYINMPKGDKTEYVKKISTYMAPGVLGNEISQVEEGRELTSNVFYDSFTQNDHDVVVYQIAYNNLKTEEATREKQVKTKQGKKVVTKKVQEKYQKEVKTPVKALIFIPVKKVKDKFCVVENVYFEKIPSLNTSNTNKIMDSASEQGLASVSAKENEQVEAFTKRFFEHYATDSVQDMAFLMKEPESLEGLKTFKDLTDLKVYKAKKEIIVKVLVNFQDAGTSMIDTQTFTLFLTKKEGQYFVQKLTHTLD